jgi:hypothetical protein
MKNLFQCILATVALMSTILVANAQNSVDIDTKPDSVLVNLQSLPTQYKFSQKQLQDILLTKLGQTVLMPIANEVRLKLRLTSKLFTGNNTYNYNFELINAPHAFFTVGSIIEDKQVAYVGTLIQREQQVAYTLQHNNSEYYLQKENFKFFMVE